VILVHDFMYFTSALTILCCLLLRRPFVLMVHVWRVNYTSALLNFCQSLAHAVFGWPAFRLASAVVTCSRENQRKIDTVRGTKTFFAANGIHASIAGAPREQPRNGAPSVFRRRVCFAGRCVEKKGLLRLKQAATSLPDVEFVIAGTGPINPATWNLPNVRSVGQLERAALVELFHQSDLLLMLSRGEGFPCVVQEAMAAGLPCALFDETWRGWGRDKERFHVVSDHGFVSDIRAILDAPLGLALRHGLAIYAQENWYWIRTAETFAGILRSAERMARLGHKREALQPAAT
jgi:starch synthase